MRYAFARGYIFTCGLRSIDPQSPWIPILQDHAEDVVRVILQKNIELRIFCGAEDEDCLPKAKQLYAVTKQADCNVTLTVQENTRHQFPAQLYHV